MDCHQGQCKGGGAEGNGNDDCRSGDRCLCGAGRAGRQRGRPAPHLAADRRRAGRHPRHHERRRDIVFPPRREQERHAGDRRERGAAGAVRLRTLRRAPGRLPRAHRLLLGALRRKHPAGVLQLPPPRARAGQMAGKGCD